MAQAFDGLSRANKAAGAASRRFASFAHGRRAAFWADFRKSKSFGVGGALDRNHLDHLWDHVTGALHDYIIAFADVFALDFIFVMERCAADGDTANRHRFELCYWR